MAKKRDVIIIAPSGPYFFLKGEYNIPLYMLSSITGPKMTITRK
jgi:hypothetical protein